MSRKHVWVWCTAFDNGRTDVQDEQRSGRPSTSTTDDIEGLAGNLNEIRNITHVKVLVILFIEPTSYIVSVSGILLLAFAITVILGSKTRGIHDHIFLCPDFD
jgi:hypothetical protein